MTARDTYDSDLLRGLVAVGALVFGLTVDPFVGAIIGCAQFGWNDLLTARWLRRKDPNPGRSRACFWFFLASGTWKVVISSWLVMVALAIIVRLTTGSAETAGQAPELMGALHAFVIGVVLAVSLTYFALWSALRNGVKVWVDSTAHRLRWEDTWPPVTLTEDRKNLAPVWVNFAALLTIIAILPVAGGSLVNGIGKAMHDPPGSFVIQDGWLLAFLAGTFGPFLGGVWAYPRVAKHASQAMAINPAECWE